MKRLLTALLIGLCCHTACAQLNINRLLHIGRNAMFFEDYVVAIQYFNQVIKARPYLSEPYFYRAYAKLNLDDWQGALADCTQSLELNPFQPNVYYCKGYILRESGRYDEAAICFQKALDLDPNHTGCLQLLIDNWVQNENTAKARSYCDSLLLRYPQYTDTYLIRSGVCLAEADTTQALADLNQALLCNHRNDLAYAIRASLKRDLKKYCEAELDMDSAIQINAFRADYLGNRAIIRMDQDNLRGAMQDFNTAIELDNQQARLYYNRALLRAQVGDNNAAIEDFSTCLALSPNDWNAYLQRAFLWLETGNCEAAANDFSRIITRYPDFSPAYQGRSQAMRQCHHTQQADKDAYMARKIEDDIRSGRRAPRSGDTTEPEPSQEGRAILLTLNQKQNERFGNSLRGQIQYNDVSIEPAGSFVLKLLENETTRTRLYVNALAQFNKDSHQGWSFECVPQESESTPTEAFFNAIDSLRTQWQNHPEKLSTGINLALYLYHINDPATALEVCEKVLERHPNYALAYFLRGNIRLSSAGPAAALLAAGDFITAYQLDNQLLYALYNAGAAYMQDKQFAKASLYFTQVIEQYHDFAEAYYNLGLIEIYAGNKAEGRAHLSKAGELGMHQAYNIIKRYAQ